MLLIGSPGGASIIPYVAEALVGILDFGLDPQAAIDRPHVAEPQRRHPGRGRARRPRRPSPRSPRSATQAEAADLNSGLHAILIGDDGTLTGAADKRREGLVMGE